MPLRQRGALHPQSLNRRSILEAVTDLTLREIGLAAEKILGREVHVEAGTDIVADLQVDSLALMNIVMELEDAFDISIPLDRIAEIRTAGELSALINDLRKKN